MSNQKKEQWSPRDESNPFRVLTFKTSEEWCEIARWYPFSVRVLVALQHTTPQWQEQARTATWEQAKDIIQALGKENEGKGWLPAWVVMKCELRGKEGREKPVLWYPGEGSVRTTVQRVGLLSENTHPGTNSTK